MKKMTLFFAAILMAVVANAQVTPPASAEIEQYQLTGTYYEGEESEQLDETIDVAFSGSDVYFKFPNPANGKAWVKGTLSGTKATFPVQKWVSYAGLSIYWAGYTGDESGLVDVVFNYDSDNNYFYQGDAWILLNEGGTAVQSYGHYTNIIIYKQGGTPDPETPAGNDELVELPDGVDFQEFELGGQAIAKTESGWTFPEVKGYARVAFDGNDVYIRGLFESMPLAWVKGTLSSGEITIPKGQYLGTQTVIQLNAKGEEEMADVKLYLSGYSFIDGTLEDLVFDYDAAEGTLTMYSTTRMVVSTSKTELTSGMQYPRVTLTKLADKAATPQKPEIVMAEYDSTNKGGAVMLTIPTKSADGDILMWTKLGYRFYSDIAGDVAPVVFTQELYPTLDADLTILPYDLYDGANFYLGGSFVGLRFDMDQWNRFGVETVYTGGGEERTSDIVWYELSQNHIVGISSTDAQTVVSETLTDLSGRTVKAGSRGLVIKTVTMADGTKRMVKTIR